MGLLITPPRFEQKYIVSHPTAAAFRKLIADSCEPDPHSGENGYLVSSVYYDTEDFRAYWEKLDGVDPRFKVRARSYGRPAGSSMSELAAPIFLEVKERHGERIKKMKQMFTVESWPLGWSSVPVWFPERLADSEPSGRLRDFVNQRPLYPVCRITYLRLAYQSRIKPRLRITLDVHLRAGGFGSLPNLIPAQGNVFLPLHLAVLEIKYPFVLPAWLSQIAVELGLHQRRYSKYAAAIEALYPAIAQRSARFRPWLIR